MLEQTPDKTKCPVCKAEIYPQEAAKNAYLCGDDLCSPSTKAPKLLDCRVYYFCSEECNEKFRLSLRSCPSVSRWSHLIKNIAKANKKQYGQSRLETYRLSKDL